MEGKTLRDEFAMAALTGFCANQSSLKEQLSFFRKNGGIEPQQALVIACFAIADAMLEARK